MVGMGCIWCACPAALACARVGVASLPAAPEFTAACPPSTIVAPCQVAAIMVAHTPLVVSYYAHQALDVMKSFNEGG